MSAPLWKEIEPTLRAQLLDRIYAEPGYLLREPGGGVGADVILAWLMGHDGQTLAEMSFRKTAPPTWRVPLPLPRSTWLAEPESTAPTLELRARDYYCQNVMSMVTLAAEYKPDDVTLSKAFTFTVAGCIYEAAAASGWVNEETP